MIELSILLLFVVVILVAIDTGVIRGATYTEEIERYVVERRPQHAGDCDRLTREYENLKTRGWL